MKSNEELAQRTQKFVASTYGRYPIGIVRGKGTHVWDASGKRYTDFVSGLAVDNLGHCHPAVVAAIRKQAGQLLHVSNLYHIEPQTDLAEALVRLSFAGKFFFCNSGTEANEAVIKLARRYFFDRGETQRHEIITFHNSFHGRTLGSLSATAQKKFHQGFDPLLKGFRHVRFNDIEAVKKAVSKKTAAVLIEPVQGEGGVNVADKKFLKQLRKLCNDHKLLLIFDEVQTAFGRTGKLFAYENFAVTPDAFTLAKALGGGMAIGALGGKNAVMKSFVPGTHAATFGGNPLACAAALAALDVYADADFLKQTRATGEYFHSRLLELKAKFSIVEEVRGLGLMLAMQLDQPAAAIVDECMDRGFLINCVQQNTLRFIPPLTVTQTEIDRLMRVLTACLKKRQS